jgi:hypothetical protein
MEVISHDQSVFLPMRFILNNIFFTHQTIQWAKKSKQSLIFLKLDFSKAYNKVEWTFLFDCMWKLGIFDEFVNMTKILFKDVKVKVNVNEKPFEEFDIEKGVWQRCPLAPYLFFIIGKTLNAIIKKEQQEGRILGIKLPRLKE